MANDFIPHICGHNRIYVPDRECTDCEKFERRISALEDIVSHKIELHESDTQGNYITAEVIGEVTDRSEE